MRNAGRLKLGYYPLPPAEGVKIREMVIFGEAPTSVIDPCVGAGAALLQVTSGANCRLYGVELDALRAKAAQDSGIQTIQGSAFDVQSRVDQFSLLYLNPPYDAEVGQFANKRMEYVFLDHTFRWLKQGGVLVFVIPEDRIIHCTDILATHFADVRVYRMEDPESIRFKQIVIFGTRKPQHGTVRDKNLIALKRLAQGYVPFPVIDGTARPYAVPSSEATPPVYRGLPLDEIDNMIGASSAYKQVSQFFLPKEEIHGGRPLTPLHGGHVGLLCTAGLLNGVFSEGEDRHIARWRSNKHVQVIRETGEEGEEIIRRRERFSNDLALVYASGTVELLGETEQRKEDDGKCTSEDGEA